LPQCSSGGVQVRKTFSFDETYVVHADDPVELVLSRPLRDKPGATWYYNGGLTQVLAGVVKQITGKPFAVFAKDVLFAPLGITLYEWLGAPIWDPFSSPS